MVDKNNNNETNEASDSFLDLFDQKPVEAVGDFLIQIGDIIENGVSAVLLSKDKNPKLKK